VDPRYAGIDLWNLRHGFDLFDHIPSAWVQDGKATFQANAFFPPDMSPLEVHYETHRRCWLLKASRVELRSRMKTIHSQYSYRDAEKLAHRYQQIDTAFLTKGYTQAAHDGAYVQEIKRQQLLSLHQGVVLAWTHAIGCTTGKRRPTFEAIEAVLERELELVAGLEREVTDLQNWAGIVEVFDTPQPVLDFFETKGTGPWDTLPNADRCCFAEAVGMESPSESNGNEGLNDPLLPFRFRFTNERQYRKRIRQILRSRSTISMRRLGRDRFLLDWFVSPDIRTLIESSARTEPAPLRRADIQQSLVWLTGEAMQQAVIRNYSLDFSTHLIIEPIVTEWDGTDGEIVRIEAVVCVCDGQVLIASLEEFSFSSSETFLVDRALFSVERSRHEIEKRQRRSQRNRS
jgi:hypothetical protein